MFRKVLIANRGEIAVRLIRACRELGVATALACAEADRGALPARLADEVVVIGPAHPRDSYLRVEAVVDAARSCGADAVHPGYGFLAERPELSDACRRAGITFVGPSPESMRLLGEKTAAKTLAERLGVPTVPGYHGDDQSDERLIREADVVGFPLLVKAAAGGGGRGVRLVRTAAELPDALASARREAEAAFGDGRLLLERLIAPARHVEVQAVADAHGHVVHLGERECSIQRRHQKLVEEAPSPAVDERLRRQLGEAATTVVRAAGYLGVATVEFLLDPDGSFFFLEVNPRLQVEHPVTELVTGVDLVHLQLQIAAGAPLPFGQRDVALRGHAVEVRLYAEDPWQDFRPAVGRLTAFAPPTIEGVRHDVGVAPGDEVTPFYDPLLGKLIAWGATREQARRRALAALRAYEVEGVPTNLSLLEAVLDHPRFADGALSTDFLDSHVTGGEWRPPRLPPEVLVGAAAFEIADRTAGTLLPHHTASPSGAIPPPRTLAGSAAKARPWQSLGGWRGNGQPLRLTYRWRGHTVAVAARSPLPGGEWSFEVDGQVHQVRVEPVGERQFLIADATRALVVAAAWEDDQIAVTCRGERYRLRKDARPADEVPPLRIEPAADDERRIEARTPGSGDGVVAPLPGRVASLQVSPGQRVVAGQLLLTIEAMKIEHPVTAPCAGLVEAVYCRQGDQVRDGALLVAVRKE